MKQKEFLFLEPFFGGSHREFALGLRRHSAFDIELVTLPARFWKWRMRGSALHFSQKIKNPEFYRGLIVTDLMSLSDLKSIWGASCPPSLLYFHENQMSYPLAPGESMDYQFGFTDITSALAANRVLFNSRTHHDSFFKNAEEFIRKMPEHRPLWALEEIRNKSSVLYPGIELKKIDVKKDRTPLIIWNHRWEFDKNPADFFRALDAAGNRKFNLALLGENFQAVPREFLAAGEKYNNIIQYGYAPEEEYRGWLSRGSVVISTAIQENFGISVIEAVHYGCIPLLPARLSYPEILPEEFHSLCLYRSQKELINRLNTILDEPEKYRKQCAPLFSTMRRYAWENMIGQYDQELDKLIL